MRISDWSSDVCSSDLPVAGDLRCLDLQPAPGRLRRGVDPGHAETDGLRPRAFQRHLPDRDHRLHGFLHLPRAGDAAPVALSDRGAVKPRLRSEEHTSELQSLMRISYAVFCLKK